MLNIAIKQVAPGLYFHVDVGGRELTFRNFRELTKWLALECRADEDETEAELIRVRLARSSLLYSLSRLLEEHRNKVKDL